MKVSKDLSLPHVLVIAGLTASGKTDLALGVASNLSAVDIISVDSRQFYQGPRIISGQDIPTGFSRSQSKEISFLDQPAVYFQSGNTRIWAVDQLSPDQVLNLSDFVEFTWQIIDQAVDQGRSLIIVGGTGLYLKAITQSLDRLVTPPDNQLRQELELLSVDELQSRLEKLNPDWLEKLNHSDKNNPRRLIRAIEISLSDKKNQKLSLKGIEQRRAEFRWVGLKPDMDTLNHKIKIRVEKRLQQGALQEVGGLLEKYSSKLPALSALGIKHIKQHLDGDIDQNELVELWTQQEVSYAKRQWTWFKKQPSIIWYDENTDRQELITDLSAWLINKHDSQKKKS